nr:hypothetical protein [Fusobacterium gastrosuis]
MVILKIKYFFKNFQITDLEFIKQLKTYFKSINEIEYLYFQLSPKESTLNIYIEREKINNILFEISKIKLEQQKIIINKKEFSIKEINIENLKRVDSLKMIIKSPMTFKIGSDFLDTFSSFVFFRWLIKSYNEEFNLEKEKRFILTNEILEKISCSTNLYWEKKLINNYEINFYIGEIEWNFNLLSDDELSKCLLLLKYFNRKNVGYLSKKGYGKIEIIN